MADTKLTVSLILNDSTFSKKLAEVNRNLKLSESEFKNAASGTKDFGNTLQGAQAKLTNCTNKLEEQRKKVSLHRKEIDDTKTTLNELVQKYDEKSKKLEKLKSKYDTVSSTMGENSKEAKELAKEIKTLEKEKGNLENRILSTNARITTLSTALNNAEADFNKFENEVKEAQRELDNFDATNIKRQVEENAKALNDTGDKIVNFGEKVSNVGSTLNRTVALPIIGIGTAAIATSMNFESAMSNVEAISGATGEDLQKLSDKAREMGASTSKSASEAADAMSYMALAGWDVEQMLGGVEPILRLSEAGAMDLATASDLVTDSMGGLKLEVKDLSGYLDIVAKSSQKSNTSTQQLLEAFINVGSTCSGLNMSLEESSAALGILANNGTKGYEAGTKLNSILARMTAQSKPAAEAWDSIGVKVYDADGKFRGLTTILSETRTKFEKLTEEEQRYFLKNAVGTDNITAFTNLMNSAGGELQELTKEVGNSSGALDDLAKTMQDNVKGQITQLKSKLEELGIKLGETLLPILSKFVDKISGMVDAFNNLSPEVQEGIVKFGLFAVAGVACVNAFGKLLTVGGSLVKFGGTLSKVFGITSAATTATATAATGAVGTAAAGTGLAGLATSFGALASAALPWVAGAAAVVGTGVAIKKAMEQEAIPAVDLFADHVEVTSYGVGESMSQIASSTEYTTTKISESTQKGVSAYLELDNAAREHLHNLYVNSTTITEETKTALTTKFTEMGTSIRTAMENDMNASTQTVQSFFDNVNVITDEEKAAIMEKDAQYYADKQAKVTEYENQINEIISNASEKKRALTEEEVNTITELQNKMRQESVNAYSATEEEAKIILGRLSSYDTRITAETASKHIQEAEKMRLKSVDAANKECNERIREIQRMRDESKTITKDQADKLIKEAERQRDESVKAAGKLKDGVVEKIKKMNEDVIKDVDTQTGKIMTAWDKVKNWWNGLSFNKKTLQADLVETKVTKYKTEGKPGKSRAVFASEVQSNAMDYMEVPNARSYAASTVTSALVASNSKEASMNDTVEILRSNLEETKNQNNLLMEVINCIKQQGNADISLSIDGRQIAKASAKYMETEMNLLNSRKNRLGGK